MITNEEDVGTAFLSPLVLLRRIVVDFDFLSRFFRKFLRGILSLGFKGIMGGVFRRFYRLWGRRRQIKRAVGRNDRRVARGARYYVE